MKNLLLFGAPGTGKGTQAALLISKNNLYHISTGDLFRKAVAKKTTLGLKAKSYMDKGDLVPDSVVIDLIKEVISQLVLLNKQKTVTAYNGFILDGFPRTLKQAKSLDLLLNSLNLKLDAILYLNVLEPILLDRIIGRRVAVKSGCIYHIKFKPPLVQDICDKSGETLIHRKDDTKKIVEQRLKLYQEQTAPLITYYKKQNRFITINGNGTAKEVFNRIQQSIL